MTQLGICATTRFYPDRAECQALGLGAGDWLVLHCYSLSELDAALRVIPAEISILLGMNNEMAEVRGDWSGLENACRVIAAMYSHRVKIVRVGNELDLWHLQPPIGRPDPRLTPAFAAGLVKRASPILRAAGIKVSTTSLASGRWPDYLKEMVQHLQGAADVVDLHIYQKQMMGVPNNSDWQTAADALGQARQISGLPVISSEAGIKVDDAGGLDRQAQWAVGLRDLPADLVCYFAWSDGIGTPSEQGGQAFGARGPDRERKPVWFELERQFHRSAAPPVEPPITPPAPPVPPVVPPPPPEVPAVATLDMLRQARWGAINPRIPFSPGLAICRHWLANPGMGSALTQEVALDDGTIAQAFTCGILQWFGGDDVREVA